MEVVLVVSYMWGVLIAFSSGWSGPASVLWPLEIIRRWWREK